MIMSTLVSTMPTAIPQAVNAVSACPAWVSVCGKLAPLASISLYLAPLSSTRKVIKDKSIGNLPLLPHTTMLGNAALWMTYGALRKEPSVWGANGLGIVMSIFYFVKFLKYAPKRSPTLPGSKLMHIDSAIITVLSILAIVLLLPNAKAADLIGNIGVAACIVLFASPLVAMKTVIQQKSAESIPLSFTLASIVCCFLWSVVGLEKMHDAVIYVPNLLGLGCGLLQLALKIIYGSANSSAAEINLAM